MEKNLLQEAILDAKTVKQVAIAQAEQTVLENLRPHLSKIFSAKIDEIEEELSMDEQEDDGNVDISDAEQFDDEALDLDEILNEVETIDEEKEEESEEDEKPSEEEPEKEEATEDAEELDIEDMSEDELKEYIEDVIEDMIQAGQLVPGEEYEETEEKEDEPGDEEVDIDIEDEEPETEDKEEEVDDLLEETNPLEAELEEANNTIFQLQESLAQQKLQNSKLLFANKILIAKSLNENKKLQVLKAFDGASTVKEVKIIYETLKTSLNSKPLIKEHKSFASSSQTSIIKEAQNPIIQVDPMIDRWQKIAGIK